MTTFKVRGPSNGTSRTFVWKNYWGFNFWWTHKCYTPLERKLDVVSEYQGFKSPFLMVSQKKIKQCEKIAVFLKSKRGNPTISEKDDLILGLLQVIGSMFLIRTLLLTSLLVDKVIKPSSDTDLENFYIWIFFPVYRDFSTFLAFFRKLRKWISFFDLKRSDSEKFLFINRNPDKKDFQKHHLGDLSQSGLRIIEMLVKWRIFSLQCVKKLLPL